MQERGKSEISRALQQFMPGCSLTGEVAKQLLGSMSGPKRDGRGTKDTKAWALKDIETSHRHIGRAHWEVILYLHGLGAYKKVNPKRTTWNVATAAGIFACHLAESAQACKSVKVSPSAHGDCFSSCITEPWCNHYCALQPLNFPFSRCSINYTHPSCSLSSYPQ